MSERASEELNFVLRARREKLEALVSRGVAPYAYSYDRSHAAADAAAALPDGAEEGPLVRVAGRVVAWRAHGKTTFAHLADPSGRIQLYFRRDHLGEETYALLDLLDIGDVVGIEGPLFRTRTGEVTVRVDRPTLLAKSLRPLPYGKEEVVEGRVVRHSGFADAEQRYRQRYADLAVHPRCARCSWPARGWSRRSAPSSTRATSSRSRRRSCSRCTAGRRRGRSPRTTRRSTRGSTCGSPTSCT